MGSGTRRRRPRAAPAPEWNTVVGSLEARGLTRADIAHHAGVHPSTITRLASGERQQPSDPVGAARRILSAKYPDA